ncbi:hypothetical protein [Streptomyces sp. NPDC088746]|uniref:hypothetical protein n=1 Tax=Streptomyces sp. NPDC088746 TaxID=3365885 RepID=UPI00381F0557
MKVAATRRQADGPALAPAVVLTGCNDSAPAKGGNSPSPDATKDKTSFRLGEPSPLQDSMLMTSADSQYTVTPTKVQMGTAADLDNSGLEPAELPGPQGSRVRVAKSGKTGHEDR